MSGSKQPVEAKSEKKNRPKVEPAPVPKPGQEAAALADLAPGPVGAGSDGSVAAQAAWLGDSRFQAVQRQAMAAGIGQVQGNQYLQKAIQRTSALMQSRQEFPTYEAHEQSIQCSPASDLIREHTTWWGNLKEEELGAVLMQRAQRREYALIQQTLDELGSTDRDDVSYELIRRASDSLIAEFTQDAAGRRMLDRLYDELTSGSVSEEETKQANRILSAKAQAVGTAQFEAGAPEAKIFPYRLPGLTVLNPAPITAERRGEGRIWVQQPVAVLGTQEFRNETSTLPPQVFTSGIELSENEIIGVRMYDLGGETHYRPALYLIQLANETTSTIYQKIGEGAAIGLTLGAGALAGAGAEGASWGARALIWADRAAFALGTVTSVIREHRGWIIERFGESGKEFLRYLDMVNSAVTIYGGARALMGVVQLANGLRTSYRNWRSAVRSAESELSDSERAAVNQISEQTDEFLENVDRFSRGEQVPGETTPKAMPETPATGTQAGPLAEATEEEMEAALEGITSPQVEGGRMRPRIEGHRTPTRRSTRMDIEDIPRGAGETSLSALARVRQVIGRKISDVPSIRVAWEHARAHVLQSKSLEASNYEELYDLTRKRFWQEIRNDSAARQYFLDAGFGFPSESTTAPILRGVRPDIPIEEIRVSLDHIKPKAVADNWRFALDADNLEMTFHNPNAYREIVQMRHPELRPPLGPSTQ